MENRTNELLESINKSLIEINVRFETDDMLKESQKTISRAESRTDNALNQIQNSFDRIHDKVFNFNNILIAAYVALGTFPSEAPILMLWTVIFPISNLIYMIVLDIRQMEIHRYASNEMEWTSVERDEFGKKIEKQTKLSLISFALSLGCLIYLIIELI